MNKSSRTDANEVHILCDEDVEFEYWNDER